MTVRNADLLDEAERLREALVLAEEAERLAREAKGGWADARSLNRMLQLLQDMDRAAPHSGAGERIGGARHWAEIVYSARKHERSPGGALGAHGFMTGHIYVARGIIERRLRELSAAPETRPPG